MVTRLLPERSSKHLLRTVRRHVLNWSVQRPILSFSIIILSTGMLLPLITAGTLMPLALLLKYSGLLASQGFLFLAYNVIIQGMLLATIIVALFVVAFSLATSASVFHSYKIFKTVQVKKEQ